MYGHTLKGGVSDGGRESLTVTLKRKSEETLKISQFEKILESISNYERGKKMNASNSDHQVKQE